MPTTRFHSPQTLHSVGALMDPGFLRDAVADATEPAHAHFAVPSVWLLPITWARVRLTRLFAYV